MTFSFSDEQLQQLGERGLVVVDGVAGLVAARAARAAAQQLVDDHALRPAGVSRGQVQAGSIRGDLTTFLDDDALPSGFVDVVAALTGVQAALREQAWLHVPRRELQLACYLGDNVGYARHRDAFRDALDGRVVGGQRRVTIVYWLNEGWRLEHGGCLRCFDAEAETFVDIEPVIDRAAIFMSERLEHAVLPSHAARFALTLWLSPA